MLVIGAHLFLAYMVANRSITKTNTNQIIVGLAPYITYTHNLGVASNSKKKEVNIYIYVIIYIYIHKGMIP